MSGSASKRIWYQSFVDPTEQAPYIDRLRDRLRLLAAPGVIVDVHGISPPDRFFHPITEFRCAEQTIRAASRRSAPATMRSSSGISRSPA